MNGYIEKESAEIVIKKLISSSCSPFDKRDALDELDSIPTANVEKVVHCSECEFFNVRERTTEGFCRCDVDHLWQPHCDRPYREPNDFCSRGVKTDWKEYK